MNIVCVKQGDRYSAEYVNILYSMCSRHMPKQFTMHCYTDDPTGIVDDVNIIPIHSDLEKWWCKLDMLNHFTEGETILFDLDVVILNCLDKLISVQTRTLSILYSQWKEGYLKPRAREMFPTLYNSSIMKWKDDQGKAVYDYFIQHKHEILLKYKGIDRYMFNEPVDVDLLPTGIAYSYNKGVRYMKDTTPGKLRDDYEVCIFNEGVKPNEAESEWIKNYWY